MAGNIIPAIATTNAVIAGLIVLQALHIIRRTYHKLKNVHIQLKPSVPLNAIALSLPYEGCGVCRDTYVIVQCDTSRTLLGELVQAVLEAQQEDGGSAEVSVYEDKRILSDPDFDDNNEKTLDSLNVTRGKFLTIVDEDGERGTIVLALGALPPDHDASSPPFILQSPMPVAPKNARKPSIALSPPSTPPRSSLKRTAAEVDGPDAGPASKRSKYDDQLESPTKKRKLEEEGLVILDGAKDPADDVEIIEID